MQFPVLFVHLCFVCFAEMLSYPVAAQVRSHDFVADNRRRIAEIATEAAHHKALAEVMAPAPKISAKYEHVTSRLAAAGVCLNVF